MTTFETRTFTIDYHSQNDPAVLKELAFDLNLVLRKELRPARLKELLKRDPLAPLYNDTRERIVAERLVESMVQSGWFVTRKPPAPAHSSPPGYSKKD